MQPQHPTRKVRWQPSHFGWQPCSPCSPAARPHQPLPGIYVVTHGTRHPKKKPPGPSLRHTGSSRAPWRQRLSAALASEARAELEGVWEGVHVIHLEIEHGFRVLGAVHAALGRGTQHVALREASHCRQQGPLPQLLSIGRNVSRRPGPVERGRVNGIERAGRAFEASRRLNPLAHDVLRGASAACHLAWLVPGVQRAERRQYAAEHTTTRRLPVNTKLLRLH